jgi:hypothetical protein
MRLHLPLHHGDRLAEGSDHALADILKPAVMSFWGIDNGTRKLICLRVGFTRRGQPRRNRPEPPGV